MSFNNITSYNSLRLALVEFLEPSEARKAFTKLAYTKYKHLPLYLEWAPNNSFTTPPAVKNKTINETNEKTKVEKQEKELSKNVNDTNKANKEESEDEDEPEPDTTLFVKNINFSTTEEQLKTVKNTLSNTASYYLMYNIFLFLQYFDKCGPLHYASIAMKKDPQNPGAKLSMGYGFVRYKRKADADRALKVLQMTVLEGKTLELKRSERTLTYASVTISVSLAFTIFNKYFYLSECAELT